MKIKTYKAYTTHSLTSAIEMYSELARRMKKSESLDIKDYPGFKIKVENIKLLSYREEGKIRYAVSVIGPIGRSAKTVILDDIGMLNAEKENGNGRV